MSEQRVEPLRRYFDYEHLPATLQAVSRPFAELADRVIDALPRCPERTVCLRKLLEAKDCAVRAALPDREHDAVRFNDEK